MQDCAYDLVDRDAREEELIMRLCRAAEARDPDAEHHLVRMSGYCRLIAEGLGLDARQCRIIFLAAPMHDIGKIAVSDDILFKASKLTAEERSLMELHTLHGFQMLSGSRQELIRHAADIAATHHERWDGTGYPARLKGTQIPLFGRIAAVADVFDALTCERPYKEAWSPEDAMAYVTACAGQHFDPDCVRAFAGRWDEVLKINAAYNQSGKPAFAPRQIVCEAQELAVEAL